MILAVNNVPARALILFNFYIFISVIMFNKELMSVRAKGGAYGHIIAWVSKASWYHTN